MQNLNIILIQVFKIPIVLYVCHADILLFIILGELKTAARWTRDFIMKHPDYKSDSVVSDLINCDLLQTFDEITNGKPCPELLGHPTSRTKDYIPESLLKAKKNASVINDEKVT